METIRYEKFNAKEGFIKLVDSGGKEASVNRIVNRMLSVSCSWTIESGENLNSTFILVKSLKERDIETFIHLKTNYYNYYVLRNISLTDEMLGYCDAITDCTNERRSLNG